MNDNAPAIVQGEVGVKLGFEQAMVQPSMPTQADQSKVSVLHKGHFAGSFAPALFSIARIAVNVSHTIWDLALWCDGNACVYLASIAALARGIMAR